MIKIKNKPTELPYFQPGVLPAVLMEMREALIHSGEGEAKQKAARDIVEEFHDFFGVEGMRQDMWKLLSAAITNVAAAGMEDASQRYNLLFFYEFVLVFSDAVYILHGNEKYGTLENA